MSGVRFVERDSTDVPGLKFYMVDDTGAPVGKIISHFSGPCWATLYGLPSELCNTVQEAKDWLIVEAMKARMTK